MSKNPRIHAGPQSSATAKLLRLYAIVWEAWSSDLFRLPEQRPENRDIFLHFCNFCKPLFPEFFCAIFMARLKRKSNLWQFGYEEALRIALLIRQLQEMKRSHHSSPSSVRSMKVQGVLLFWTSGVEYILVYHGLFKTTSSNPVQFFMDFVGCWAEMRAAPAVQRATFILSIYLLIEYVS